MVNVCTAEVQDSMDVAIVEGRIVYVGNAAHCVSEDTTVIDAAGAYIAPGFLDGHIHVESSMVGVGEYARAVIPHGTVGIYWDPHEIANVLGLEGVQKMPKTRRIKLWLPRRLVCQPCQDLKIRDPSLGQTKFAKA